MIYTTHDITLLDKKFFRRDQIWFVQKDEFGYSQISALSDFKVRSDASFEKDYLAGVYGGIPYLKEFNRLYLHFNYSDAALHRHQWNEKFDELFSGSI